MKINVCVNGTFRYPDYIRFYEQAGVLSRFFYAHGRATTPATLGLRPEHGNNLWLKEYLLRAAFHAAPEALAAPLSTRLCDGWQREVIRRWQPCDSMEAVIGGVADKVIAFAKRQGVKVLGHPVTTHPATFGSLVGRAYESLGLDPDKARLPEATRRMDEVAGCDRLAVDSALTARSFAENGTPADRIAIVQPAFDPLRFHPRAESEVDRTTFLVLCVGIVTPRKAQHLLLQAWRSLKLPDATLVLVGAMGRDGRAVVQGFEGDFTHKAHIRQSELRALLVRASCFVLPSAEDGFGQAPLEAMACGVPVIVTRNVGMADVIRHETDGFIVPPFESEPIAAAIEALYRDRDRAAQVGEAAARTAHRTGGWAAYVERIIDQHGLMLDRADACEEAA